MGNSNLNSVFCLILIIKKFLLFSKKLDQSFSRIENHGPRSDSQKSWPKNFELVEFKSKVNSKTISKFMFPQIVLQRVNLWYTLPFYICRMSARVPAHTTATSKRTTEINILFIACRVDDIMNSKTRLYFTTSALIIVKRFSWRSFLTIVDKS